MGSLIGSIIVGAIVLVLILNALRVISKDKKAGKGIGGCGSDCNGCSGGCNCVPDIPPLDTNEEKITHSS